MICHARCNVSLLICQSLSHGCQHCMIVSTYLKDWNVGVRRGSNVARTLFIEGNAIELYRKSNLPLSLINPWTILCWWRFASSQQACRRRRFMMHGQLPYFVSMDNNDRLDSIPPKTLGCLIYMPSHSLWTTYAIRKSRIFFLLLEQGK